MENIKERHMLDSKSLKGNYPDINLAEINCLATLKLLLSLFLHVDHQLVFILVFLCLTNKQSSSFSKLC